MEKEKIGKSLYTAYRGAMAYIEVKKPNGDFNIGSAFHIGNGVFVTARHVVFGNKIISMATTEYAVGPDEKNGGIIDYRPTELTIKSGPHFHEDEKIDVAVIVTNEKEIISIPLGGHLDDWINDSQFIMSEVIIMGYPPVPFAKEPLLISARGEINGVVDKRSERHPYFIISAMARGGFSGGVCIIEWNFVLGLIVQSLVKDDQMTELGFMAVLTIEPILGCLAYHKLLDLIEHDEKLKHLFRS